MQWVLALAVTLTGCDAVLRLQTVSDRHPDALPDVAIPDGLVAYYPFESLDQTCASDVVGGHDGTCTGGTPTQVQGPAGHGMALALDGQTYAVVPTAPALDTTAGGFTIAVWVAPAGFNPDFVTYSCVVNRVYGTTGADSWQICGRPSDTYWLFGGSWFGTSPLQLGGWTHLALTWDGQTMTAWAAGAMLQSATAGQPVLDAQGLWFGADNDGGPAAYYTGALDEIRIYNRALSADEIVMLAH
jgi:hypothetical protein